MSIVGAFILPHPPIILPEIGRGKEREIQKTIDAYREIARRIAALKPDTIVLTSPHSVMYADYFHISPGDSAQGDLRQFGASGVEIGAAYDTDFVASLTELAEQAGLPAGTLGQKDKALDHGTMIPLRFLNAQYSGYKLVRVGLSGLDSLTHYRLGKCIAAAAQRISRRVVFVASGDLSHKLKADGPYGLAPEGAVFDCQVTEAMAAGDFLRFLTFEELFCDAAAECGLRSFQIMAGALDGLAVQPDLLSYEGTFGVGYAVAAFSPTGTDETRRFDLAYERQERARLDELVYSVDVLSETEPIKSATELDVKRYGVIVTNGRRRGLLLPNLEGVDTVERQLAIAKQKAGIRPEETCGLERFEVVRHK